MDQVDQATIVSYAFGYLAALIVTVLILLPVLVPILLLLLVAGVLQLLAMGIRALGRGIYQYSAGLIQRVVQAVKNSRDGPRRHSGHRLHTH